jgi:peptidoglycan/xylan/chitin deacetylase (PgdA/CDA1 family)
MFQFLFMVSILFSLIGTLLAQNFPAPNRAVPGNPAWTNKFLKGVSIPQGTTKSTAEDHQSCKVARHWAMTFDDGSTEHTLTILDALKKKDIKATFFVVGSRYAENPRNRDILKRTFEEGHEIALHTWSHMDLTTLTNDQIVAEIVYNSEIIRQVIGVSPKIFRAPYGSLDQRVRAILKAMGLDIVYWSFDSDDWMLGTSVTAEQIYAKFSSAANSTPKGTISLQHDLYEAPSKLVPRILDILDGKFSFTKLSECLDVSAYDDYVHNVINDKARATVASRVAAAAPSPSATRTNDAAFSSVDLSRATTTVSEPVPAATTTRVSSATSISIMLSPLMAFIFI